VVVLLEGLSHITAFIAPVCEGNLVIFISFCHQPLDIIMQNRRRRRTVIGVESLFMCITSCFCS
jgi:hypothetical protein